MDRPAVERHRHQDGAAADAEHAGQKSRQRPDRDQEQGEFDELLGIEAGHHVFEHPTFRTCGPSIYMARPRDLAASKRAAKSAYRVGSG
jgi:hypothetical protein